jgi:hypothetical protein
MTFSVLDCFIEKLIQLGFSLIQVFVKFDEVAVQTMEFLVSLFIEGAKFLFSLGF